MPPSRKCSKRPSSERRRGSWRTACSRTIGIWSCGPRRRGVVAVHGLADADAYAPLARAPAQRGKRPRVPGPVQVLSRPGRRPFLHAVPVSGTECVAAHLVRRAEDWRWGSLYRWKHGPAKAKALLAAWPLPRWPGWAEHVNAVQTEAELAAVCHSVQRGNPLGDPSWSDEMVRRLGLESTLRARGRPKKRNKGS